MTSSAQNLPVQAKATSVLVQEVEEMLDRGQYEPAAGHLDQILQRIEVLKDPESLATRSSCLFQLGICRLKSGDPARAADAFRRLIREFPSDAQIPLARFMVLESYARLGDPQQMSAWLAELRSSGAFDELVAFFSDEKNADLRRNAVLSLVSYFAEKGDLNNLRLFFPFCDEAVLADAGFNTALISGGDQALDDGDFARALVLYRMARRAAEVIPVYQRQLAAAEAELARPLEWIPAKERDRADALRRETEDRRDALLQAIDFFKTSGFDADLELRAAQCFAALQRHRIAIVFFEKILAGDCGDRTAEQCRASVFQSLLALDEQEAAIASGRDYIERYPTGRFYDEVAVSLMQLHLSRGEPAVADALGRQALAARADRRLADQITYLLGMVQLQFQKWTEASSFFTTVRTQWPRSLFAEDCEYWQGMCLLFEGRYQDAATAFSGYLKNPAYKPARFAGDVTYRLGVARYGLEDFASAEETFKEFLVMFPDHVLVSEACSMLGDMRGADGDLDQALLLYRTAVEKAVDAVQDTYAVFQMARVYEMQKNYGAIVDTVKAYMARRGADADLAEAGLWIGRASKASGNLRQALDIYLKTIADFGNDPQSGGVDRIQAQLLTDLTGSGAQSERAYVAEQLVSRLATAEAQNRSALVLRCAALLVRLDGAADYAGRLQQAGNQSDLSPLPLVVLAESAARNGDAAQLDGITAQFKARFASSELLLDLLNVEAAACTAAGRYDQALAAAGDALDRFGDDPRSMLSRKLYADACRLSGDLTRAVESYQKIFSTRGSQGSLAPESLYWIGVCRREQGQTEKAFAFFQRIYVLYKSYPEWVAKAYVASAECLEKLGRSDEAVLTLQEMLAVPELQPLPEARQADQMLKRLKQGGS